MAILGSAFTAAALGLGAILFQTLSDDSSGKDSQTATQQGSRDTTFSEGTLQNQVTDLLAKNKKSSDRAATPKHPWGVQSNGTESESGGVDTLITPTVQIPDCIQQGTGNNGAVLAAQKGTYKGASVYLVVLPDASDGTKVTAYIVDAACTKPPGTSPGKLLLTHSYARS